VLPIPLRRLIAYSALFFSGWLCSWWYFSPDENIQHAGRDEFQRREHAPSSKFSASTTTPATLAKKKSLSLPKISDYDQAALLLSKHQYTQFIQMYIGLRAVANESQISRYQNLVLNTVRALQQKKHTQQALELLSLFLEYEYDNSTALILYAELQHIQKNYLASMDALFRARSYAHQIKDIDAVNKKLRALVAEQRRRLSKEGDPLALLDFYRRLTELEPDYGPNFIGLAEVHINLGNLDAAHNALSLVVSDPSISARLDRVYAKLDQAPALELAGATPVALVRIHDQFLIDVIINNGQTARLLLDTGASISIISPSILNALGLDTQKGAKMGWFNTANGVVSAPIYTIQSLSVEENVVESIDVGVLSISSSGEIDGLLGMNFFKHFNFYIDQKNSVLFLR